MIEEVDTEVSKVMTDSIDTEEEAIMEVEE